MQKPFNLKQAQEGGPVCLKDGTPVRLLCFDRESTTGYNIVGLIQSPGNELIAIFNNRGLATAHDYRLCMAPRTKKIFLVTWPTLNEKNKAVQVGGTLTYVAGDHMDCAKSEAERRAEQMRENGVKSVTVVEMELEV